jgi:hypothetical protein
MMLSIKYDALLPQLDGRIIFSFIRDGSLPLQSSVVLHHDLMFRVRVRRLEVKAKNRPLEDIQLDIMS